MNRNRPLSDQGRVTCPCGWSGVLDDLFCDGEGALSCGECDATLEERCGGCDACNAPAPLCSRGGLVTLFEIKIQETTNPPGAMVSVDLRIGLFTADQARELAEELQRAAHQIDGREPDPDAAPELEHY